MTSELFKSEWKMTKRLTLIISLLLIGAGIAYFFFKPSAKIRTQEALNQLSMGNFSAAEAALSEISKKPTPLPLPF
ncbi:MAG: hypothetical protein WAM28_03570, partial [Chlamydiales bacterium]